MVSTQSGHRLETPLEDSHPHPAAMADTNTLQQLQNRIVEMERCHEEELRKLKAAHDQLEACVRRPQDDGHSAYTLPERTQGDAILPPRVLDRRLQEDWARVAKEGPRVLMNLRVDF